MVTGDSQEEVLIFRDKQTHMHHNIYIIIIMLGILTSVHKLLGVSVVNISVEFPQLVSPGDCDDDLMM